MTTESEQAAAAAATTAYAAGQAAKTAAQVASDAVLVASQVAARAEATANKVAEAATKTADSVLLFSKDITYIKDEITEIKNKLDSKYVTVDMFWPVKTIVYSGAGIVLIAVAGAIVALVVNK